MFILGGNYDEGEKLMEIIAVTLENLAKEHICCAISDTKGDTCVSSKKAWLAERFKDGLVFKKLNARGKAFIEYIPAEKAWCPIDADGYVHINCFCTTQTSVLTPTNTLLLSQRQPNEGARP
jgi:hypothetical protein